MVKILVSHNRQDITYSFSLGQKFPDINGKLLRLEVSGAELLKLSQLKEIPICCFESSYCIWNGKNSGKILKLLREIFE